MTAGLICIMTTLANPCYRRAAVVTEVACGGSPAKRLSYWWLVGWLFGHRLVGVWLGLSWLVGWFGWSPVGWLVGWSPVGGHQLVGWAGWWLVGWLVP